MLPRLTGLRRRIMTYVAVGLLALFGLVAALTWRAIQQSTALIAEQRLSLARMLAVHLDSTVHHAFLETENAALTLSLLGDHPGAPEAFLAQLRGELTQDRSVEVPGCLAVFDAAGEVLWAEAEAPAGACSQPPAGALARSALAAGRQAWLPLAAVPGDGRPGFMVATPLGAPSGPRTATAALVAGLRPTLHGAALQSLLAEAGSQRGYRAQILAEGRAVDTSVPEPPAYATAHWRLIAPRLGEGRGGLVEHQVRTPAGEDRRHFIAFVPLTAAPWAVVVEQSYDLALTLPRALRNQMLVAGMAGLLAALAVAWVTTRQVIQPLSELTTAAQRIAGGDLEHTIRPSGHDEVHSLGGTLEGMRRHLKALLEERDEWGHVLERQVVARTRELAERNRELAAAGAENRRLYEQVLEKEQQRRRLLERTMVAYEEERKRVARELHDEVGQALTGLIVTLDNLTAREASPKARRQALQGLRELTNASLGEVRRLIAALRPSLLDDLGLVPAIHSYAKTTLGAAGVAYQIDAPSLDHRLPPTVETALFRIAQEAITNVVRHARAHHVSIRLRMAPEHAEVVVEDDGSGFDASALAGNGHGSAGDAGDVGRHVGLLGMRERAELLGGRFEVMSSPGQGTRVHAAIPVELDDARLN